MRLGFYHHLTIEPKGSDLYVIGHFGRFLDGLAQYCDELILFMHQVDNGDNIHDYRLQSSNISWVNMGASKSAPYRTIFGYRYRKIIKKHLKDIDTLLIRGPSPLLPALSRLEKLVPVALLIGGDYLAGVDSLPQATWRKELIRIWSKYYNRQQLVAAQKCLTLVNSHKLFEDFEGHTKKLVETRTTTLNETDFFWRDDTCAKEPYHLLYTGRIDLSKGLLDILEAIRMLEDQHLDVIFDLVGKVEKDDLILNKILRKATDLGVSERVIYHGYKMVGPALFEYYKDADVYVIASQSSEGFPRTVWEAMAHCLPVVATRVGSIPHYLRENIEAMLVGPRKPQEIAAAVTKLVQNSDLRQKIIKNGYQLAKANTINNRSREMLESIQSWKNEWESRI